MEMQYPKRCACCRRGEISAPYEVCEICGWISDPEQEKNRFLKEGKNAKSLEEAAAEFAASFGMSFCAE